jgi:uncharacterized membrane protein
MPFCSQCGNVVRATDVYCGRCGARQPVEPGAAGPPPPAGAEILGGLSARTASILCYIPGIGWLAAIVVLAAEKFRRNRTVRFHAFQGLYLFVAWLMEDWVLRPMAGILSPHFAIHRLVEAVLLGMSIFMMVKASHDEAYALPLFGELAQRSVVER